MKPGYLTTEFAALVALVIVTVAAMATGNDHTDDLLDVLMLALPGYAVSRGLAKAKAPDVPPEDRPAR